MKLNSILVGLAIVSKLAVDSTYSQIPQNVEHAVTGNRPTPADVSAARQEVQDASQGALSALYAIHQSSRREIERADGYATFSTSGMKLMVAGDMSGKGIARNNLTGSQTFMQMSPIEGGRGFGASKNQLIFVFTSEQALFDFIHKGWDFGSQANLGSMAGGEGGKFTGALQVSPGVYLYQITETGLNITPTVGGSSFSVDSDLN
jgi:lipid-binding SYLF domain-containing protein